MHEQTNPSKRPDIFEYRDFRLYLNEMYEHLHSSKKSFSKAYICRALGLPNSRSYFGDVIAGKYLSPAKVPSFIELFEMNREEARYFRVLVNFNQAFDDPSEQDVLLGRLIGMSSPKQDLVAKDQYEYYREPRNAIVRAMLDIIDVKEDDLGPLVNSVKSIASPVDVRDSVDIICRLGLAAADDDGFLRPVGNAITSGLVDSDIVKLYQLRLIELARTALGIKTTERHNLITKVITVSEIGASRIQDAIENFRQEISAIVCSDDEQADRVCQVLVAFHPFALSKKGKLC